MKKSKKRDNLDINKLLSSIIFALIFTSIILSLYIGYSKIKYQNYLYSKHINELLKDESIAEKKEYLSKLNNEMVNIDNIVSQYKMDEIENNIKSLTTKNDSLQKTINQKQSILENKKSNYQSLVNEYNLKTTILIPNIITYNQYPKCPNGCEVVALYIMLKHYNVNVDIENIMDSLPKGNIPYMVDGKRFGGDPNYEFLGDPRRDDGWGIYDKGLAITANKFKPGIINGTGMEFSKIYSLIDAGRPVVVWTSIDLKDPYVSLTWTADTTGETIKWKRWNHAETGIGYNDDSIIVSDPINGKIRYFNKKKFIMVYDFMGRRALYY